MPVDPSLSVHDVPSEAQRLAFRAHSRGEEAHRIAKAKKRGNADPTMVYPDAPDIATGYASKKRRAASEWCATKT